MSNCEKCGFEFSENELRCECCEKINEDTILNADENEVMRTTIQKTKKSNKKHRLITVALVIAIILTTVLIGVNSKKSNDVVFYLKDSSLYYTKLNKIETIELTDETYSYNDLFESGLPVFESMLSPNGKIVFYPKDYNYPKYELYYKDTNGKNNEKKIDSRVERYYINNNGKTLVYLTKESEYKSTLYKYDVEKEERTKLFNDVSNDSSIAVSENAEKLLYITNYDDLYECDINQGTREKIDENVNEIKYPSEDLEKYYYLKKNNTKDTELYSIINGQKRKIDNDIEKVVYVYDSGEMYYIKEEKTEEYVLYYYNGNETVKLDALYIDIDDLYYEDDLYYDYAIDNPVIVYKTINKNGDSETYEVKVAKKEKTTALTSKTIDSFYINAKGDQLYYLDERIGYRGNLNGVKIEEEITEPVLYDTNVYYKGIQAKDDGGVTYYKNCFSAKFNKADFYANQKYIGSDIEEVVYVDKKTIYYITDWDESDKRGHLMHYNGKKSKEITQDVNDIRRTENGELVYLGEYSADNEDGTLFVYNGKKSDLIDYNVTSYCVR